MHPSSNLRRRRRRKTGESKRENEQTLGFFGSLTSRLSLWYDTCMKFLLSHGDLKIPGWMIHRNSNRATSTFAA
jgi:hypothetical protein